MLCEVMSVEIEAAWLRSVRELDSEGIAVLKAGGVPLGAPDVGVVGADVPELDDNKVEDTEFTREPSSE